MIDSVNANGEPFGQLVALGADTLFLAQPLINPLPTTDTVPNAISVYVPVSAQPGSEAAT